MTPGRKLQEFLREHLSPSDYVYAYNLLDETIDKAWNDGADEEYRVNTP